MSEANSFLFNLTNSKKSIVLNKNNETNRIMKYIGGDSIIYKNIYIQNENSLDYYGRIYETGHILNIESDNINLSGYLTITGGIEILNNINSNILSYNSVNKTIGYNSQSYITLTGGNPTFNWDVSGLINNAKLTLSQNSNLVFTNLVNGSCGCLIVAQNGTGGYNLTIPANSKVINGGSGLVEISTDPNSVSIITFTYDGSFFYWNYGADYT